MKKYFSKVFITKANNIEENNVFIFRICLILMPTAKLICAFYFRKHSLNFRTSFKNWVFRKIVKQRNIGLKIAQN